MTGTAALLLSVLMLAAAALVLGGVAQLRRNDRKRGWLMLVAALVLAGNVLIWTI